MLALWILAAVGLLLITAAWVWGLLIRRKIRTWTAGTGQYDSRVREQRDLLSRYRFSYTDPHGRTRYFSAWTFFAGDFHLGDEVPLILDPTAREARVNRFGFLYAHPLELAAGGLFLLALSAWALITHP